MLKARVVVSEAFRDPESSVELEPTRQRLERLVEWYVERRAWPAALVASRRLLALLDGGPKPNATRRGLEVQAWWCWRAKSIRWSPRNRPRRLGTPLPRDDGSPAALSATAPRASVRERSGRGGLQRASSSGIGQLEVHEIRRDHRVADLGREHAIVLPDEQVAQRGLRRFWKWSTLVSTSVVSL
ncbi:MAG: hypothetical protein U0263_25675 [Polyangiaceae bacterium]